MRKAFVLSSLRLLRLAAMLIAASRLGAQAVTQHRDAAAVTGGTAVPRPTPHPVFESPVFESPEFARAVARGTRTRAGRPARASRAWRANFRSMCFTRTRR